MAYFIKDLSNRNEGDKIIIKLDIKKCSISLYEIEGSQSLSLNFNIKPYSIIEVNDFEAEIVIPSTGFWILAVRGEVFFSFIVNIERLL